MKKALCIGIDNYPGIFNDLQGCVNDMRDWADILASFGFSVTTLADSQARIATILSWLSDAVSTSGKDDYIVLAYSGHGTQVQDTSGDEPDLWDEALYLYDGTLLDDTLRTILGKADVNTTIVVICDSCFSGTVTRALAEGDERACLRYLTPIGMPSTAYTRDKFRELPEEGMVELLLTGCDDDEYSGELYADGEYHGVMTYYATTILSEGMSYDEWYTALRECLPSDAYPQTPQLEGRAANKVLPVFGGTHEEPPGPPIPGDEPDGCLSSIMGRILRWFAR